MTDIKKIFTADIPMWFLIYMNIIDAFKLTKKKKK